MPQLKRALNFLGSLVLCAIGLLLVAAFVIGLVLELMDRRFWHETVPELFYTAIGVLALLGLASLFDNRRSR